MSCIWARCELHCIHSGTDFLLWLLHFIYTHPEFFFLPNRCPWLAIIYRMKEPSLRFTLYNNIKIHISFINFPNLLWKLVKGKSKSTRMCVLHCVHAFWMLSMPAVLQRLNWLISVSVRARLNSESIYTIGSRVYPSAIAISLSTIRKQPLACEVKWLNWSRSKYTWKLWMIFCLSTI